VTALVEVGSYVRDLGASVERLFENALDWEHLPHVHAGSFASIVVDRADGTGWSATALLHDRGPLEISLELDRGAGSWVTRNRIGGRLASEIRSQAEAIGPDRCRVTVAFHVPELPEDRRAAAGAYYRRLYAELYDEDERMMIARAEALRRGPGALREHRLVALADGGIHKVPLYCPHRQLPLDAQPDASGIVTCPWHGYRFDVRTGLSADDHACGWARLSSSGTRPAGVSRTVSGP